MPADHRLLGVVADHRRIEAVVRHEEVRAAADQFKFIASRREFARHDLQLPRRFTGDETAAGAAEAKGREVTEKGVLKDFDTGKVKKRANSRAFSFQET